jgi:asparagine synthase (glutamine-hydrolysing)
MQGVLGDFLLAFGVRDAARASVRLADPAAWPPSADVQQAIRHAAPSNGVLAWFRGDVHFACDGDVGGLGMALDPPSHRDADPNRAASTLATWIQGRRLAPPTIPGRFAFVAWEPAPSAPGGMRLLACTDAFRTCPIYVASHAQGIVLASDLRLILRAGFADARVSLRSIYHYLNFSYVPAPVSAIEAVTKLPAAYTLQWQTGSGAPTCTPWWDATYPADHGGDETARVAALRDRMIDTVKRYGAPEATGWGTFLSGGTDSSSIASILAKDRAEPVHSFSIGFDEAGYDELGFSQIAADAFGLVAHQRRVGENDAVALIPRLVQAYDEPFGNSSAIPTFFCAELAAREGVAMLVAGDGGDEIFGGNERYRKDRIFEGFHRLPSPLRGAGGLLARSLGGVDTRFANRIKNFVRRGSLPNPDRFYTDDSFASDHFETLLSEHFRSQVQPNDSLEVQRTIFQATQADADLHRLMYLDLKMTIAENDVVKVVRAARLAGVQVAFPYLDRDLIDFTGRLPADDKVRGLNKRHLFKLATQEILPEAIRQKKKQGFGLPVSVWMRRPGPMQSMVHDIVLSQRAIERGYFQPGHVRALLERHERGAWDHASEIYLLLMLELWHREYVDNRS